MLLVRTPATGTTALLRRNGAGANTETLAVLKRNVLGVFQLCVFPPAVVRLHGAPLPLALTPRLTAVSTMDRMEKAALAMQSALSLGTGNTGRDPDWVSDAVVSRSDDVGGRGLFAERALSGGEEILRIPHAALVTMAVGQRYAEGAALKKAADVVEDGGEWPEGVVIKAAVGEREEPDFPNEETYIVMALVCEDAMRRRATAETDAAVAELVAQAAFTEDEGLVTVSKPELDRARRYLYYAALPTVEELREFHPIFSVPRAVEPEPEPDELLPPIPKSIAAAIDSAGLGDDADATLDLWRVCIAMHATVLSEHVALCAILGQAFAASHPAVRGSLLKVMGFVLKMMDLAIENDRRNGSTAG